MNKLKCTLFFAVFYSAIALAAGPSVSELKLVQAIADLQPTLQTVTVEHDPVYRGAKSYQAFPLGDILKKLALPHAYRADEAVVVFTATDGYKVSMAYQDALRESGYIAVRDNAAQNNQQWLDFKFGKETLTPAPYYLIWPKKELDEWRFPWPFQMAKIAILPAKTYFGAAAPQDGDAAVRKGFYLFSRYCIRCHSVNLSGGEVGPELNVPKNITEYFKEDNLAGFILNATTFRTGTKMPVFENLLSRDEALALVAYLKQMKLEKKP